MASREFLFLGSVGFSLRRKMMEGQLCESRKSWLRCFRLRFTGTFLDSWVPRTRSRL